MSLFEPFRFGQASAASSGGASVPVPTLPTLTSGNYGLTGPVLINYGANTFPGAQPLGTLTDDIDELVLFVQGATNRPYIFRVYVGGVAVADVFATISNAPTTIRIPRRFASGSVLSLSASANGSGTFNVLPTAVKSSVPQTITIVEHLTETAASVLSNGAAIAMDQAGGWTALPLAAGATVLPNAIRGIIPGVHVSTLATGRANVQFRLELSVDGIVPFASMFCSQSGATLLQPTPVFWRAIPSGTQLFGRAVPTAAATDAVGVVLIGLR